MRTWLAFIILSSAALGACRDAAPAATRAPARFAAVLGKPASQVLTGQSLFIAVAAYVRPLEAVDSRFDRAIRVDTGAVSPSERRGFNLFTGKAGCRTCHFAPLFGRTMPPNFMDCEPEVIGV